MYPDVAADMEDLRQATELEILPAGGGGRCGGVSVIETQQIPGVCHKASLLNKTSPPQKL